MKIVVDGQPLEVPEGATVAEVLKMLGEPATHILVEVNGAFIRPKDYDRTRLLPGEKLEVIYPAFGG